MIQEFIGLIGRKLLLHSSNAILSLRLGISSCLKDGSLFSAANLAACKKKVMQWVCFSYSLFVTIIFIYLFL